MNIFTVDGNIGCGKSSVLEYIHQQFKIPVDLEPVDKWQKYLENMYYKNEGAFAFQVRIWLDRCWIQSFTHTSQIIMERSPLFQRDVFVPINHENGRLNDQEYQNVKEMYDKSMNTWSPKGSIYIRSDPIKCYERIHHRNRKSEEAISLDYLKAIHDKHELTYQAALSNGYNILCVDMENKPVEQVATEIIAGLKKLGWQ